MKHTTSAIAGNANTTPANWRRRLSVIRLALGANVGVAGMGIVVLMVRLRSFESFSNQHRVPIQSRRLGWGRDLALLKPRSPWSYAARRVATSTAGPCSAVP